MIKKKINLPNKDAGRRLAAQLRDLRKQIPQEPVDGIENSEPTSAKDCHKCENTGLWIGGLTGANGYGIEKCDCDRLKSDYEAACILLELVNGLGKYLKKLKR